MSHQNCSQGQCIHGRCLNHESEWENVGEERVEVDRGIFGKKLWWFDWCCGKPMTKMKKVQTVRCRQCGRKEDQVTSYYIVKCECCGWQFIHVSANF